MFMFEGFLAKVKMDWWEVTNLGIVGYFRYAKDWCKYLLGISNYKPDLFAYSEIDMDMNLDFSKDQEQKE